MANISSFFRPHIAAIQQRLRDTSTVDEDAVRKIGLMYGLTLIGIFFLSMLGAISYMQGGPFLATLDFLVALLLLGLLFLLRIKGYLYFCIYTGITIMYCLYLYLFISGGIAGNTFLWSYTFPLFTFFLLGTKKGFLVSSLYLLSCLAVLIIDLNSSMINLYDKNLALRFIPSFAAVILFSLIYEKFRENSQQALMESKNTLEKKVAERTGELQQEVQNRKKKEQELRVSEARYRTLYENSGDGISIISLGGRYLSANQQFCNRLGYSEDDIKTKVPRDIYQDGSEALINAMLKKVFTSGSAQFEAEQVTRSGVHIPVEIRAQRIAFDNEDAILCSCRDISERRKQEEEKRNLHDKLFRASKMEAIGLMAGGIAHDLNNILAGITGYPELLLLKLPPDSELRRPIKEILHSGQRAAAVVADLLTVARGVAKAKEPHDCNSLIEQFLATLEARKIIEDHPDVEIITHLGTAIGSILCSAIHFQKCIMNLLLNALEAVGGRTGAQVEITTNRRHLGEDVLEKLTLNPGDYVLIRIRDNGPGISSQDIEHIFEPFYTKKKMDRSGTGLGLTVVWNAVHEHHGTISVDSSEQGTTFTLYFPATDNAKGKPVDDSFQLQEQPGGHILVVDDEQQMTDIAEQMLISLGYSVKTVNSGEEAVAVLQREKFDLILLDMVMDPGMNGRQTYEEIIKMNPGQKALVASGYSDHQEVKLSLALGVGGLIKKPYSLNELRQAVQKMQLRGRNTE